MSILLIALLSVSSLLFASDYTVVTDDRLSNPEPENWLMYRGTYDSHGFSPLDEINSRNVKKLKPLWTLSTGMREGHQSPPIVNDGYLFITTPHNHVMAVNAVTGDLLWRYVRELPEDQVQMHPTNRGVALYDDLVLMATADCYVVALDAKTGEVVWETLIENYESGYYMTLSPLVASGKVMVGVSGGEFGIRGFVEALDAKTGEKAWKTYTIPAPGEPGSETWFGDSWKTGGVPVWITGSYDKETNLSYWGTGNGGPWMGDTRAGDNLYATSVIAIDVENGRIRGHHQYHWNDSWDWDEVSAPLLIDFSRKGELIKGLVHPGRNGYMWFLERGKEDIKFIDAQAYVKQDVFLSLDPVTGRPTYDESKKPKTGQGAHFCPSHWGGKDWPPAAFNPETRLLFVPANDNVCAFMIGEEIEYREGREFMGTDWEESRLELTKEADEYIGELQAWHVDKRQKVWSYKFKNQNWGPVLATAGNLVFMGGTSDRYFRAFDAKNGRLLWQQRTNSGITGVPSSFEVDGKQYIAVLSGWGVDAQRESDSLALVGRPPQKVPQGGVLWVFGL
jgi:alcohol dehydrogenase (cytochrome c)